MSSLRGEIYETLLVNTFSIRVITVLQTSVKCIKLVSRHVSVRTTRYTAHPHLTLTPPPTHPHTSRCGVIVLSGFNEGVDHHPRCVPNPTSLPSKTQQYAVQGHSVRISSLGSFASSILWARALCIVAVSHQKLLIVRAIR